MKKIEIINQAMCARIIALIVVLFIVSDCFAQPRAQADVNISAITLTTVKPGRPSTVINTPSATVPANQPGVKTNLVPIADVLKCSVTIHSYWDDDAYSTMLAVVLPVEVSVIFNPSNGIVNKAGSTSPFAGNIVFNLGQMAVNQSITVEFTFTKSQYGNKVDAYAYSATPDPNPANNYKDATY
jgi:hypothetical protein